MRLWLTHTAKPLNHQRRIHSCRLTFTKHIDLFLQVDGTLETRLQKFCINSFVYEMVWKIWSWRNCHDRELRQKCLTTKFKRNSKLLPVLRECFHDNKHHLLCFICYYISYCHPNPVEGKGTKQGRKLLCLD